MGDLSERARVGVPVAPFPAWAVCPLCRTLAPLDSGLFKLKTDAISLDKNRWVHENCHIAKRPPPVLPARFLVACENGHLDDFPWHWFVHRGAACEPRYKLFETGPTGEAADVLVRCEACGQQRVMAEAFGQDGRERCRSAQVVILTCERPRRLHAQDARDAPRLVELVVSGFPLRDLGAVGDTGELARLIEAQWATLQDADDTAILGFLRKQGKLGALAEHSDDAILVGIIAHKTGADKGDDPTDLRSASGSS